MHYAEELALDRMLKHINGEPLELHYWQPWMLRLLYDETLSISEIEVRTGKTKLAIMAKMSELRGRDEPIPIRAYRRRNTRTGTEA